VQLAGRSVPLRGVADSWTKILFHQQLRMQCIVSAEMLAAAASEPAVSLPVEWGTSDVEGTGGSAMGL